MYSDVAQFYYFAIPYLGICLLIAFLVCLVSYYQLCCKLIKKNQNKIINASQIKLQNIKPIFRITHLFCITMSTLGIAMDWSKFIVCGFFLDTGADIWPNQLNPYYAAADGFYYAASISFYIMAFLKPYDVFRETIYRINSYVFYFYVLFISISAITAIYYVFAVVYFVGFKSNPQPSFFKYDIPAMIILTVNDFILNTSLMILFVSRLRACLFERAKNITGDSYEKWGNLITKHALLFTISIITNQLFLLSIIVSFATIDSFGWYWTSFRGTENVANVIVLYLALAMNTNQYNILCGKCHKRVKNCFMRSTHSIDTTHLITQKPIIT